MIELLREEHGCVGIISGAITIYDVAELKNQIDEYWHRDDALSLDLAGVSEIDTAGVQLLLALRQAAGKGLSLKRHSPAVIAIFDLYQLAPLFGDVIVLTDH